MLKYAFKVKLNQYADDCVFNFAVKNATLSDIFEAKRITDHIQDQYKEERIMLIIDEYRHGDEVEEVENLYELENELKSRIRSLQRHNEEVLDKLNILSDLLDKAIGSHRFDAVSRKVSLTLAKLDQYFYFDITVDDFSDYKITLSTEDGAQSSLILRTADEVLAEIVNVEDILTNIEKLANETEFDLLQKGNESNETLAPI